MDIGMICVSDNDFYVTLNPTASQMSDALKSPLRGAV